MIVTKEKYEEYHTKNLVPTKWKIDCKYFEEQIHVFPFYQWGDTHTEFPRFACPLVNKTGTFHWDDQALGPLDRLNFLKEEEISPFIIRKHVLKIRKAKISDPQKNPNVGSFFKNPIISLDELEKLKLILPSIKFYSYTDNKVKISAAFLIESLNLKGFALNNARVSEKHSLVLENKSEKSEDILDLASHIQASVLENYKINLELEPQIF